MKKITEPQNAWEYADWLYGSGRLTVEEYNKLQDLLFQLEDETMNEMYQAF
jgi:hypothetical protein